jgi:branched-chain amino acid aminotransferase
MGELAAVNRVDGRTIGDGKVGPLSRKLSDLYQELVQRSGEQVVPEA